MRAPSCACQAHPVVCERHTLVRLHIGTGPVDTLIAYIVQIGLAVLILGVLLRATVFFLVILLFPGRPRGRLQFLVLVLRRNTERWLMLWMCGRVLLVATTSPGASHHFLEGYARLL